MQKLGILAILALFLCTSCGPSQSKKADRVLFVGNSLTYVGNLPAVFSALARSNGRAIHSDMIVRGGATLAQRVADGSVARALSEHRYTMLVLQERGGDLLCSFSPAPCTRSQQAIKALAKLAREKGVPVVLLGTYQSQPSVSRRLVEDEASAASAADVGYVEVSETLRRVRTAAPELAWFYADGMHPGKSLVLLDAILVYRQIFGTYPLAGDFIVKAPIYTNRSGLTESLRAAEAPPPRLDTPRELTYASATMERLLGLVEAASR